MSKTMLEIFGLEKKESFWERLINRVKGRRERLKFKFPNFKHKSNQNRWQLAAFGLIGVLALLILVGVVWLLFNIPSIKSLRGGSYPVSTQIFDRNNQLLYEVHADENRTPIKLEDLPDYVKNASIAIEDKDFYHHFGFSLQGILRAFKNTVFANKLQGGSTITQQLVKTALLSPERTIDRKIKEAILTIGTEIIYSKNDILELYLNHIPYGGTAYGVEAAAKRFFGKSAKNLTIAEAALIAGLPQAPSRYSPFINPEAARLRQRDVLRRMFEDKYITKPQYDEALNYQLTYAPPATNIRAPHFVFFVKNMLEEKYGMDKVERGGLRVKTTLDLELQDYAQASVAAEIKTLEKTNVSNGAVMVTNPKSGEILAMVGSKDYFDSKNDGQVNLTQRLRQPGSSIKPINYVTGLQLQKFTASSIILDLPTCFFVDGAPKPYCPKNYDGGFRGPVNFRFALANSLNIPAVKILAANSIESMIATASAMGITTFKESSNYGLSLTLGGGEVTMNDMMVAFGTLANQGVKVPLSAILEVSDYTGKVYESWDPTVVINEVQRFYDASNPDSDTLGYKSMNLERVLNREPAFIIADIMADNNARSAVFGANSKLKIKGKTVSVKTGTTNDIKDNWTIGFTPSRVVATWVGNNDATPMNPWLVSGITGAAPIWNSVMTKVITPLADEPQPKPDLIETISICSETGTHPDSAVPCNSHNEYFWGDKGPDPLPVARKQIWLTRDTKIPPFLLSTTATSLPEYDVNNVELVEKVTITDLFTRDFCLDCTYPVNEKGRIQYPTTDVDMKKWGGNNLGFEELPY